MFPYLPEMISSFGVEKNEVARWAGITGAVFSVSQSLTAVPWGRASDTFGRKPIILIGLASTMFLFLMWGMATSLPMAIAVRAIMGGSNGNVGIIRTIVAELVPEKELQPRAFSIMPLVWSIGSVFGPAFGGFFARPVERRLFGGIFENVEYFRRYPFALPNLVACFVFFLSFMTGLLFLKETLESKRHQPDWGLALGEKLTQPFNRPRRPRNRRRSFVDAEASAPLLPGITRSSSRSVAKHVPPSYVEIFTSQTTINLISYTFLALHSVAYDQVLPVFLNYPVQVPDESNTHLPFKFSGGFGLTSDKIGTIYATYGIACGIIQFFLFPIFCARFGVLNCYKAATMIFPLVYLITPYSVLIQNTHLRYAFFLFTMLVKGLVVIIAFPCTTIMLTNSASSVRILGTLNGYATSFSGLGRAVGPALTGAVFSIGVQRGYVIAPWWVLAGIAMLGAIPAWFIVEGDGPSREFDEEEEEEEEGTLVPDGEEEQEEGIRERYSDLVEVEGVSDGEESVSGDEVGVPLARGAEAKGGKLLEYGTAMGESRVA